MQKYPKAIGPYSVYREANGLLFVSGQLAIDPDTGELVGENVKEQTRRALENVKAVLDENGLNWDNVVKTTCFLADINDFSDFNKIYAEFFTTPYPARSAFAVKDLPKGARVEIEIIAAKQ
ncbi:RidA family protein [Campylobacter sp.]|uniref:RidA family protein n=1 Tax=Campylobacter sp. TaxID=205 RepID=UPI0026DB978B|nr:RidA family protein [Campylobacter sp.]MDO4674313.1 RidA family protein [Campylobacter sp.]